ncbi:MAG: lipopolysaccharide biosynthesis protein [Bacteroidaceae bacterium]|nr:lipopolysaccharide biosynthesis protein [Bacteroidaceae bacterium]
MERISVQAVSFIVTIVLARLILPEEYGIIALITIFIALAEVIADGGFNTALIQKKNADSVDFSTIFYFCLAISIVLYFILFLSAPLIASFYEQPMLVPVIRVLGISLIFYSFNSIQRAYVSRNMMFRKLFYCTLGATIISGTIGIVMAYRGYGVWALVSQTISNQLCTIIIMWFTVKWRPILSFSRDRFQNLFNFGWKIFCTNFIITFFVRIRALVIGKLFSPSTLAYYEKGAQFPDIVQGNVCSTIQSVIFPALSEVQDDTQRVKSMMRRSINTSCLFMFPIMVGMMIAAKPLVVFLLTDKWIDAVPFLQILCIANFFRPITIPNLQAIIALGHSDISLKLEIIKKMLDVIILAVSCFFGAKAIAWGCVLFNFACIFINLLPNIKLLNYKIHEQILDVIPTLLLSGLMGVTICWIPMIDLSPLTQLIIIFVLGVCTYAILCRIFRIESFMYLYEKVKTKFRNLFRKN